MRKYTEARKQGNKKWDSANLDRMSIALPKGYREAIKARADKEGLSVNAYIREFNHSFYSKSHFPNHLYYFH